MLFRSWAFNEEAVARAIYNSKIPVVSAVGHEIDFTIADFVADLRAPTPSAAAELVVRSRSELFEIVRNFQYTIHQIVVEKLKTERERIRTFVGSYAFNRPVDFVRQRIQQVDELERTLSRLIQHNIALTKQSLQARSEERRVGKECRL